MEAEQLRHRDTITVTRQSDEEGKTRTVYNWVNIKDRAVVRGGNPSVEKFNAIIGAGDSNMTPSFVTKWVAEVLDAEFGIDVSNNRDDIEVVDLESDTVTIL